MGGEGRGRGGEGRGGEVMGGGDGRGEKMLPSVKPNLCEVCHNLSLSLSLL